jgi:molybdate transport system substrate-binding protein
MYNMRMTSWSSCPSWFMVILLGLLGTSFPFAQGELTVFSGGAMSEPVHDVGGAFARSSSARPTYVVDTTGALQKKLAAGEKADVIVVTSAAIDALEKNSLVVKGTKVELARGLIGVGVRAGAPGVDLSSTETFKAALLKATSVSYVNPASGGTSGTYFEGLLATMGIADQMQSKIVYRNQGSEVADAVAKGEAEIGITFTSELAPNTGVKVAGTLPAAIQMPTIYAAALVAGSPNEAAARAYLKMLAGPEGRAAITKAGLEALAR